MKLPELPLDTAPSVREAFEVLARESAELRAAVEALKSELAARPVTMTATTHQSPAAPSTPSAPSGAMLQRRPMVASPPRVAAPAARVDMEKLLGRYGAWGAAALMILLGVGTLLEWAIRNGMLGPSARVALSTAVAVALAVGGYVARKRASVARESLGFGNACLGLALGVLDVVAWQIGPQWHMVPATMALELAVAAAAALVSFGMREEDELLAAVGAAGLYLAPFVTSSGDGSALVLAAYVALVSLVLFRFVERDTWAVARAVIRWGSLLCTLALIAMREAVLGAVLASVLAVAMLQVRTTVVVRLKLVAAYMVAAIVATLVVVDGTPATWTAALAPDRHTGWLASAALLVAMVVASRFTLKMTTTEDFAGVKWSRPVNALLQRSHLSLTFTLLLPVAAVLAAATALPADTTLDVVWLTVAAGFVALAVAFRSDAPLARQYYTTGFVLLWVGALSYSPRSDQMSGTMLLAVALIALWMVSARPDVRVARYVAFMSAAYVAVVEAGYMFTAESRVVPRGWMDIVLMAGACAALAQTARLQIEGERGEIRVMRTLAPWIAALLLARHLVVLASGSYTAVALTAFYAATGVALIIAGRRRGRLALRRGGLGLSLYAPLRAFATATDVDNTGVRVAVYFVAGMFMLLVAFLYRSRGGGEAEPILADVRENGDTTDRETMV